MHERVHIHTHTQIYTLLLGITCMVGPKECAILIFCPAAQVARPSCYVSDGGRCVERGGWGWLLELIVLFSHHHNYSPFPSLQPLSFSSDWHRFCSTKGVKKGGSHWLRLRSLLSAGQWQTIRGGPGGNYRVALLPTFLSRRWGWLVQQH